MVSCIILSAGLSSRFGGPKALAPLDSGTVIQYMIKTLISTNVDDVVVVLGAHKSIIKPYILKHKHVRIVYNKDYILGQTSSFKAGLKNLDKACTAAFLLPIDYPLVEAETFNTLIRALDRGGSRCIAVPTWNGLKGHPPLFSLKLRPEILGLAESEGMNQIIRRNAALTVLVPVEDRGVWATYNTLQEYRQNIISQVENRSPEL